MNRVGPAGQRGERGPTGDHGPTGPMGETGDRGPRAYFDRGALVRLAAYIIVVVAVVFAVSRNTSHDVNRVRDAESRVCERVQILRDQANGTQFLIYDTFKRVRDQQTAAAKNLKGTALMQAKQSIERANRVVQTVVVTGPTDCDEATLHPNSYVPPVPAFIDEQSPGVKLARKRSSDIIKRAKDGRPLYDPANLK